MSGDPRSDERRYEDFNHLRLGRSNALGMWIMVGDL